MLELGIGASLVRGIGWIYAGLFFLALFFAIKKPKTKFRKVSACLIVLAIFWCPVFPEIYRGHLFRVKQEKATALFKERCKTAGERIYHVVNDVSGITFLNLRISDRAANEANSLWVDAGLPNESSGDSYIWRFLLWEQHQDKRNSRGYLSSSPSNFPGYRFVDVQVSTSQSYRQSYRYSLDVSDSDRPKLRRLALHKPPSRYSVIFENIVNASDRESWVAGTKVSIVDTQGNRMLAEATWYSFEPGLGNTSGGRQPWRFAISCPPSGATSAPTRFFVDRVLKPSKGE